MGRGVNETADLPLRRVREKTMAKKKPKLGTGKRFKSLKQKLARKKGVSNPGALAAAIGRKKFGKKKFAKLSAKGRKKG
jgi:hypothetical protein